MILKEGRLNKRILLLIFIINAFCLLVIYSFGERKQWLERDSLAALSDFVHESARLNASQWG